MRLIINTIKRDYNWKLYRCLYTCFCANNYSKTDLNNALRGKNKVIVKWKTYTNVQVYVQNLLIFNIKQPKL